jgi:hypothetical protein
MREYREDEEGWEEYEMKGWNRRWRFFSFGENEETGMTNLVERFISKFEKWISVCFKTRHANRYREATMKRFD